MTLTTSAPPTVELLRAVTVGNPNVGKSSLINALAGSDLHVGNWQGTTVERLEVRFSVGDREIDLVDLPGAYSLAGVTGEETITRRELCEQKPDLIINVVDAGNLERNLAMTVELCELGIPMVVVLNLWDEAVAKGLNIDIVRLSERLGVPVVTSVARRGEGIAEVRQALSSRAIPHLRIRYADEIEVAIADLESSLSVSRWLAGAYISEDEAAFQPPPSAQQMRARLEQDQDPFLAISEARLITVQELCQECTTSQTAAASTTSRIDALVLNRWLGLPIFMLGMLLLFRFTFLFSQPWIDCLQTCKQLLAGWFCQLPLPPLAISFLNHGLLDGVGTVVAFIPVLFLLYLFMGFLESSGFLARTTFIFDRLMAALGLPGRALIPLLLGFGCNVASIYATRTIQDPRDRLRVALASPFMACSARLTVFVLFGTIFFPANGSTIGFGLYMLGLAVGLVTAGLLGMALPKGELAAGIMELPPYRFPAPRFVARLAHRQVKRFLKEATGPILCAVLLVWVLMSFPQGKPEESIYARSSMGIQKVLTPIGVTDWRLAGALVPGFIAKEVVIGTLGVSYLGAQPDAAVGFQEGIQKGGEAIWKATTETVSAIPQLVGLPNLKAETEASGELQQALAKSTNQAGALAYLVFVLLYTPCVATIAAIKQEFGWRWAGASLAYQLMVAYACAFVVYQVMK